MSWEALSVGEWVGCVCVCVGGSKKTIYLHHKPESGPPTPAWCRRTISPPPEGGSPGLVQSSPMVGQSSFNLIQPQKQADPTGGSANSATPAELLTPLVTSSDQRLLVSTAE